MYSLEDVHVWMILNSYPCGNTVDETYAKDLWEGIQAFERVYGYGCVKGDYLRLT